MKRVNSRVNEMCTSSILEISAGRFSRENACLLDNVDLKVRAGEIVLLHGANGIGKSTLIETIAGMHELERGELFFCGTPFTTLPVYQRVRAGLRLVRDRELLFGALTVSEHFKMIGNVPKFPHGEFPTLVSVLDKVWERKPATLSGGEQRIVAILHALTAQPKLLMIDEFVEGLQFTVILELLKLFEMQLPQKKCSVLLVSQSAELPCNSAYRAIKVSDYSITVS